MIPERQHVTSKTATAVKHLQFARKYCEEGNPEDALSRIRKYFDAILTVIGDTSGIVKNRGGRETEGETSAQYIDRLVRERVIPGEDAQLWHKLRKDGNLGSHADEPDRAPPTLAQANQALARAERTLHWFQATHKMPPKGTRTAPRGLKTPSPSGLPQPSAVQPKPRPTQNAATRQKAFGRDGRNREVGTATAVRPAKARPAATPVWAWMAIGLTIAILLYGVVTLSGSDDKRKPAEPVPLAIATTSQFIPEDWVDESKAPRDPFGYCRGHASSNKIFSTAPATISKPLGTNALKWRCADGQVLACRIGASGRACLQMNTSRSPTAEITNFCQVAPNTGFVPMSVIGNSSSSWTCKGASPKILRTYPVDKKGYQVEAWRVISDR